MDFKSFIIGLVVGIFGPYMDDVIRKIFSKFQKRIRIVPLEKFSPLYLIA